MRIDHNWGKKVYFNKYLKNQYRWSSLTISQLGQETFQTYLETLYEGQQTFSGEGQKWSRALLKPKL